MKCVIITIRKLPNKDRWRCSSHYSRVKGHHIHGWFSTDADDPKEAITKRLNAVSHNLLIRARLRKRKSNPNAH